MSGLKIRWRKFLCKIRDFMEHHRLVSRAFNILAISIIAWVLVPYITKLVESNKHFYEWRDSIEVAASGIKWVGPFILHYLQDEG